VGEIHRNNVSEVHPKDMSSISMSTLSLSTIKPSSVWTCSVCTLINSIPLLSSISCDTTIVSNREAFHGYKWCECIACGNVEEIPCN